MYDHLEDIAAPVAHAPATGPTRMGPAARARMRAAWAAKPRRVRPRLSAKVTLAYLAFLGSDAEQSLQS